MSDIDGDEIKCFNILDIEYDKRCEYLRNASECQDKAYLYKYIQFLYCSLMPANDAQQFGYLMLFLALCIFLFIILGFTAEKFYCPSLEMISKIIGLSEHLAGVTVLAFGNGFSDLFTSFSSIDDSTTFIYSNLLGAAIFVSTFVSCVVCFIRPFRLGDGSNHLRDVFFFTFAVLYVDYAVRSDNCITIWEAACIILIYILFLVVIFLDQFFLKRRVNLLAKLMLKGAMTVSYFKEYEKLRQQASIEIFGHKGRSGVTNIDSTRRSFYGYDAPANKNLWKQFAESLNPIDHHEWSGADCCHRTMMCLKAPIIFVLGLFIPNADYIGERHGWSKLLNCIQVVVLPVTTFLIIFKTDLWLGVPPCVYMLTATLPLAILGFIYSRTDKPPKFHVGIALLSAYGSMFVLSSCAYQVVQILFVFAMTMKLSNSFMGCTFLAWGNSIGDLIANSSLAFYGYHRMALAGCYGGPFFNTLMSFGIIWLIKTIKSENGYVNVDPGPLGENCYIFILLIFFCTLMWSLSTNFHVRRSMGAFGILMYGIFFLYILFAELDIIQTYADQSDID